mgnify:FL=1
MKILDKLKNALFEEEYVEVEEKKDKKEKPIAKKIVLPETRTERREEAVFEEDEVKEELPKEEKKTFKFPAISEDDFADIREKTPTRVEEKPKPVERREVPQDFHPAYPPRPVEKKPEKLPYGNKKEEIKIESYGTYEKKETTEQILFDRKCSKLL